MAVDTNRLRFGDMIAGGSAVLLFFFMFLNWYKATVKAFGRKESDGASAWDALGFGKVFLLILIIIVIGAVVVRLLGAEAQIPVPLGAVMLGAGVLATLYILFRIIDLPGEFGDAADALNSIPNAAGVDADVGRAFGIFLSFLAAIGMAVGGFLSMNERGEAIPGVGGPLGAGAGAGGGPLGGGGGGPLGGGQPAAGGYAQPTGGQPAAGGQPAGGAGAASAGVADPGAGAAAGGGGNPPADWYDDPRGEARLRYWDGQQWTDQTAQ
jgi:hypothetical protein